MFEARHCQTNSTSAFAGPQSRNLGRRWVGAGRIRKSGQSRASTTNFMAGCYVNLLPRVALVAADRADGQEPLYRPEYRGHANVIKRGIL